MLLFTLAPLAALVGSLSLVVRRSPSGPMATADAQLPFLGALNLNGGLPGSFVMLGLSLLPDTLEAESQFMLPRKGVLRSLLVKNIRAGDDAVELLYKVRVNGKDVGLLSVKNNAVKSSSVNLSQVNVSEEDLVSLILVNPGFSGAPPVVKVVLLWRPL